MGKDVGLPAKRGTKEIKFISCITVCIFNFQVCTMGTIVMGLGGEWHVIITASGGRMLDSRSNMLKPQMKQG